MDFSLSENGDCSGSKISGNPLFSISFQVKESSENLVGSNLEKETNSLHDVIKVGKDIPCVTTFQ